MRLLAPAKLNLHLRVGRRRADGFHPLGTWMCTIGLFDTIRLEAASSGASLKCDDPDLPSDDSNLALRAAGQLAEQASRPDGVHIDLSKRIPVGAGLGGGSSDAARVLLGLNRLWGLNWSSERLGELAARIGSDVAFFCYAASGICTDRGQIVRPIAAPGPRGALLILPEMHLSTAAVYQRFDEMGLGDDASVSPDTAPDWSGWSALSAKDLLACLVNDLEPAAFDLRPELGALRKQAEEWLGRAVRMSGSGSSLFSLYDTLEEAERAAGQFRARTPVPRALAVPLTPRVEDELAGR
jgi:4-diphosphocytidyl-2-C-methyl-D-erythritol kinase